MYKKQIKYLYCLVSSPKDVFYEQAYISIISLKIHMPDAYIILFTDNETIISIKKRKADIRNIVDEIIFEYFDNKISNLKRSRILKTLMRNKVDGDFLYIDSDTIITDDLSDIQNSDIEIGAVLEDHTYLSQYALYKPTRLKFIKKMFKVRNFNYGYDFKIYFNGGVFFCKDCKAGYDFFNEWHRLWLQCFELKLLNDQASLNQANFNVGNTIKELDGIWNCQLIHDGSLKYFHKAKIIHYFTTNIQEKYFLLANREYTQKIKETGIIDQETIDMLKNAKSQFAPNTRVMLVNPALNDFYDSAICGAAKRLYHTKAGGVFEVILSAIKRAIFTPLRKKIFLRK